MSLRLGRKLLNRKIVGVGRGWLLVSAVHRRGLMLLLAVVAIALPVGEAVADNGSSEAQTCLIAYHDNGIYVIRADGSRRKPVPTEEITHVLGWWPDGKSLLVLSGAPGHFPGLPPQELSRIRLDGSTVRVIARPQDELITSAAVSPDGKRIVYGSQPIAKPENAIHMVAADGTDNHVIVKMPFPPLQAGLAVSHISWSPRDSRIAYEWDDRIWQIDDHGKHRRQLFRGAFRGAGIVSTPTWSPDGRSIAFGVLQRAASGIYRADPGGTNIRLVARADSVYWVLDRPTWSPDGTRIAFYAFSSDKPNRIEVINADGGGRRHLAYASALSPVFWQPRCG